MMIGFYGFTKKKLPKNLGNKINFLLDCLPSQLINYGDHTADNNLKEMLQKTLESDMPNIK